jgi:hypothetical protein
VLGADAAHGKESRPQGSTGPMQPDAYVVRRGSKRPRRLSNVSAAQVDVAKHFGVGRLKVREKRVEAFADPGFDVTGEKFSLGFPAPSRVYPHSCLLVSQVVDGDIPE